MKKGDKVTIIPNEKHAEHVKKNYGKILKIDNVLYDSKNEPIYKIKGVRNYAIESDLQLA